MKAVCTLILVCIKKKPGDLCDFMKCILLRLDIIIYHIIMLNIYLLHSNLNIQISLFEAKLDFSNSSNFIKKFFPIFSGQLCCDCKEVKRKYLCVIKAFFYFPLIFWIFPIKLEDKVGNKILYYIYIKRCTNTKFLHQ